MQNVEFKAELRDPQLARIICRHLGATHIATLEQRDTYFRVPDGRLKKRETKGEPTEYVFYHRQNRARPRLSHFTIYSEEQALQRYGSRPLPVWLTIEKKRDLWMYQSVRLHFDEIESLGRFFEAEALVTPRVHVGRAHRRVNKIRDRFAPALGEIISVSYSDMIARQAEASP